VGFPGVAPGAFISNKSVEDVVALTTGKFVSFPIVILLTKTTRGPAPEQPTV